MFKKTKDFNVNTEGEKGIQDEHIELFTVPNTQKHYRDTEFLKFWIQT